MTSRARLPSAGGDPGLSSTLTIMADIKFACPNCNQHITCDELWGGHQLECPGCKSPLMVPANAPPEPAEPVGNMLVPKPPASFQARLSTNPHTAGQQTAAPQRTIP